MEATGFQIEQAKKIWFLRRDTATSLFADSLKKFETETKEHPTNLAELIDEAEDAISHLQVAAAYLNGQVLVKLRDGGETNLLYAIKRLGGAQRLQELWKKALPQKKGKEASWSRENTNQRNKDVLIATPTMQTDDIMRQASLATETVLDLRAAISMGNNKIVNIPFLKDEYLNPSV